MNISGSQIKFVTQRFFLNIFSAIFYISKRLLGLAEFFLFLRLLLKFLGASSQALVIKYIYGYSNFFVSPFDFIFPNFYWRGHLVEIDTISAMIGYALAVYILFWLLKLFSRD